MRVLCVFAGARQYKGLAWKDGSQSYLTATAVQHFDWYPTSLAEICVTIADTVLDVACAGL
jgi:hypothetical protein